MRNETIAFKLESIKWLGAEKAGELEMPVSTENKLTNQQNPPLHKSLFSLVEESGKRESNKR